MPTQDQDSPGNETNQSLKAQIRQLHQQFIRLLTYTGGRLLRPLSAAAAKAAILLGLLWFPASAETPLTDTFQANIFETGDQDFAEVAMNSSGESIVAWFGDCTGTTDCIVARRYGADGNPTSDDIIVIGGAAETDPFGLDLADNGNFVVAWQAYGDASIDARLYDNSNTLITGTLDIGLTGGTSSVGVDVAFDSNANFVVTWATTSSGIQARRYDAGGNALAVADQVSSFGFQEYPRIDVNNGGDFVVAWETSTGNNIEARTYISSTMSYSPVFTPATTFEFRPSVAIDSAGDSIIAWIEGTITAIKARRYDLSGAAYGAEFVIEGTTVGQKAPGVSITNGGQYTVAWGGALDATTVYGRQYTGTIANTLVTSFTVESTLAGNGLQPVAVGVNPVNINNFIIGWDYDDGGGNLGDIYGRIYGTPPLYLPLIFKEG